MATATSVEALAPGDHACLTFTDPDERLDIGAAFVRDGISNATKVMCVTETTAVRMVDLIGRHVEEADRQGYAGLPLTADMSWVNRPIAVFHDGRLTAICRYDRQTFDAVTLAFAAAAHARTVAAAVYYEDPVLRICRQHTPPGIRLAGEIDFHHLDALTLALNEALLLDHDVQVNLARLRFLDAACAAAIIHAALSLPAQRVLTVVCCREVLRVLRLAGMTDLPAPRVVGTHGER